MTIPTIAVPGPVRPSGSSCAPVSGDPRSPADASSFASVLEHAAGTTTPRDASSGHRESGAECAADDVRDRAGSAEKVPVATTAVVPESEPATAVVPESEPATEDATAGSPAADPSAVIPVAAVPTAAMPMAAAPLTAVAAPALASTAVAPSAIAAGPSPAVVQSAGQPELVDVARAGGALGVDAPAGTTEGAGSAPGTPVVRSAPNPSGTSVVEADPPAAHGLVADAAAVIDPAASRDASAAGAIQTAAIGLSTPGAPTAPGAPPTSGAPPASGAPLPPASQVAMHLVPLRLDADGIHRLTVHLHPADLGMVSLVAEIREGSVHLQLAGATEAGREALRAALPDLRRELQQGGFARCSLDLGPGTPQGGHPYERESAPWTRPSPDRPAVPQESTVDQVVPITTSASRLDLRI